MLRTLLVALDASPFSETAATLALQWATRFGARLIGLGILDTPSLTAAEPVPLGASYFKRERDTGRLLDAQKHVAELLENFQSRCEAAGLESEVFEEVGDAAQCILREAHQCDLVILGHESHFHFETQDKPDQTLAHVLHGSPRPIVVAPAALKPGNGVMVAYGGGSEVARTLQVVQLLGLAQGQTVHLVSVSRADKTTERCADLAARFLESHQVPYEVHLVESNAPAGQVLLERVHEINPQLLVMGSHIPHHLRDLFTSSVSQTILTSCPVPVLIGS
jgi:nucleotide-binding universal stress UspA family protein